MTTASRRLRATPALRAYAWLERLGARAAAGMSRTWADARIPVQVQRVGSMFTVFPEATAPVRNFADAHAAHHGCFATWFRGMRRHGVLLPPSGYESLFTGLAHTDSHIDEAIDASRLTLDE
ncbi:MAG: hypothetical protein ACT4P7_10055 [Gemmatimonadaceae bacterium]